MKLTNDLINQLIGVDDVIRAPGQLLKILFDQEKREDLFKHFLNYETDLSYDWFGNYYMAMLSEKQRKKQYFTPIHVSKTVSNLIGYKYNPTVYEPCAGTGGMTVSRWWHDCIQEIPFIFRPHDHFYQLEELSDRCIPFLLFNCAIRGMNAIVIHCDTLTREAKGIFFIQNERDDFLRFSSINVMPYTDEVADYFNVKWTDYHYPEHVESDGSLLPEWMMSDRIYNEDKSLLNRIDAFNKAITDYDYFVQIRMWQDGKILLSGKLDNERVKTELQYDDLDYPIAELIDRLKGRNDSNLHGKKIVKHNRLFTFLFNKGDEKFNMRYLRRLPKSDRRFVNEMFPISQLRTMSMNQLINKYESKETI